MKIIQRLLSVLLVCCMMLGCLPATVLAAEVHGNEYTDAEIEVSPETAAALVSMLTGEEPGEPTITGDGYVFDMPDRMVNDLAAAINEAAGDTLGVAEINQARSAANQKATEDAASDESAGFSVRNEDISNAEGIALGEAEILAAEEDGANTLPEDYVDDSNDALYEILEEMAGTPMLLDGSLAGKKIDLFFVIDSTGSMSGYINNVKANVAEFARSIGDTGATLRLGLIDYRDITVDGDSSTTVHEPGYSPWMDVPGFISELTTVRATGGGDPSETPIDALGNLAQSGIGWNSDAYKFAMLITDASYKANNNHDIADMDELTQLLQNKGVIVSTITPSHIASFYGDLAGLTGGVQIPLSGNFAEDMMDFAEAVIGTVDIGSKPTRDYTLRVLDGETGLPVAGASVAWVGGSAVTDDTGTARIVSADSPVRGVTVTRDGYIENVLGDLYGDKDVKLTTMTADPDSDAADIPTLKPSMFKNPGSGNGTLRGPELDFLGKKFNLIDNVDIALNLPLFSSAGRSVQRELNIGDGAVKIANDSDNKLFKVTIGETDVKGSDVKDPDSSYWKEDYKRYKSLVKLFDKKKSNRDIYNEFRTLRKDNREKPKKGDIALPVDFQFAGYAEVSYASGALEVLEGGVVIGATSRTFEKSFSFPPQPWIFLKITFKMDMNGKFAFVKVGSVAKTAFEPKVDLEFGAESTVTLNAGVRNLAYVGGGLKGNLDAALGLPLKDGKLDKSLTVDLTGKFTVEVKLLGFKKSKDFGNLEFRVFPWGSGRSIDMLSLDELDDGLALIGQPNPILSRAGGSYEYEKDAVYEDAAPQLVCLDNGTMLLVWVDAAAGRSDANLTALHYTYKPANGSWSAPAVVDNDGTSDFMPSLGLAANGTPILVWQNSKTTWPDVQDDLTEIASDIELKAAVYNSENNKFGTASTISNDNDQYATAAQVVPEDAGASVYWVETAPSNLLLGENLTSTIYRRDWDGSDWGTPVEIGDVGSLDGFAVGQIGATTRVAYAEGSEITVLGDTKLESNGDVSGLQIVDGSLYWSDADGLKAWNGSGGPACDSTLSPDDFIVLTNGSQRVLLIRQYTDYAHELYASIADGQGWSAPVPVTEYGNMSLSAPSAILAADGSIRWACGRVEAGTDPGSDLVVDSCIPTAKVVVGNDAYISDMVTAGETAYASVDLSNVGLAATPISAEVEIKGTSTPAAIYRFSEDEPETVSQLGAGEYLDAGIQFTVPTPMNGETVTITFKNGAGNILGTATGTLPAAAPDIEVTDAAADGLTVTAKVANIGTVAADNVAVTLTQEGVDGTIDTQTVSLPAGAQQTVTFTIGAGADLSPDTRYDHKRFIITAEPTENEVMLGNNSDSVLIAPQKVTSITINGEKNIDMKGGEKRTLTWTVTPEGAPADVAWMSTKNSVATVDNNGEISAWGDGQADIIISYILDDGTALQDKVTVTVTEGIAGPVGVSGVTVNPGSATIGIGKTAKLTAVISPSTAADQGVTWRVDDPDVLRIVSGDTENPIEVEGLAEGQTKVTVRTNDGAYTASANITVTGASSGNPTSGKPSGTSSGSSGGHVIRDSGSGRGDSSSKKYSISVPGSISGGKVTTSPGSASKGTSVTITVKPDVGYELDYLDATEENGAAVKLTDKGSGKYTFIMPGSKVTVEAGFKAAAETAGPAAQELSSASGISFADVAPGAYYYDAVLWAVGENITSGTTAASFSPDIPCTRAQVVTFLWRAAGSPAPQTSRNPFTDVSSGEYYYDAVLWAAGQGIVAGTSTTTFSPDAAVTRAQAVSFLYRAAGSPAVSGTNHFADVGTDAYYAPAVRWAVEKNIAAGTGANTFAPDNDCTRGQIVTFLYRNSAN